MNLESSLISFPQSATTLSWVVILHSSTEFYKPARNPVARRLEAVSDNAIETILVVRVPESGGSRGGSDRVLGSFRPSSDRSTLPRDRARVKSLTASPGGRRRVRRRRRGRPRGLPRDH